ncbi:unnamed protein product [Sphacelaria rigidula]
MRTFFCLRRWRVLTATRRYPTQGYQAPQWQAPTGSLSGLVEGHFGTETIHSLIDRFSLSIVSPTLNLTKILLPAPGVGWVYSYAVRTVPNVEKRGDVVTFSNVFKSHVCFLFQI